MHCIGHVDRGHGDFRMSCLKYPEHFIRERLTDLLDAGKIQNDGLESFKTPG